MALVLVVEDSRTQAQQIQMLLEEVPFEVEVATNGLEALDVLRREPPDIVLTDLEMPHMNGLELVEAIRREFAWVPVVLMTAHGSEEIAALALSKGAASYIPKAYLAQDVVPTLERILALTEVNRKHTHALTCMTKTEYHFVLDNDTSFIAPIIGFLDEMLKLLNLCDPTERLRVSVALQEACLNAIYHGNLEVSSSLRQEDESIYHDQIKLRRTQPPFESRRIFIDVNISPEEATYTIRDEGRGFDPSILPDPSDPENLEKVGGRGLMLIRTFMDKVFHNPMGNAITLVKHRDPPRDSPAA
jgi:CheY-like chemotaxis protein/anti-sigma regulatory factor (Ser/Thr protein kinase)